ncbi:MAG: hypothetical protein ACI8PT_003211 [Gammaproteobacteria bacterium]|jgi:hypothetical protein
MRTNVGFFVAGCVLIGAFSGGWHVTPASAEILSPSPSMEGAVAYIISPKHGEVVSSPLKVVFGLSGMGISPAGVDVPFTGHHHLLIDTGIPDLALPVPADARHRHYGGGQSEAIIELPPGEHILQLLLGDHAHVPHQVPVVSEPITVIVR